MSLAASNRQNLIRCPLCSKKMTVDAHMDEDEMVYCPVCDWKFPRRHGRSGSTLTHLVPAEKREVHIATTPLRFDLPAIQLSQETKRRVTFAGTAAVDATGALMALVPLYWGGFCRGPVSLLAAFVAVGAVNVAFGVLARKRESGWVTARLLPLETDLLALSALFVGGDYLGAPGFPAIAGGLDVFLLALNGAGLALALVLAFRPKHPIPWIGLVFVHAASAGLLGEAIYTTALAGGAIRPAGTLFLLNAIFVFLTVDRVLCFARVRIYRTARSVLLPLFGVGAIMTAVFGMGQWLSEPSSRFAPTSLSQSRRHLRNLEEKFSKNGTDLASVLRARGRAQSKDPRAVHRANVPFSTDIAARVEWTDRSPAGFVRLGVDATTGWSVVGDVSPWQYAACVFVDEMAGDPEKKTPVRKSEIQMNPF